jgi:heat shock protein HslJ
MADGALLGDWNAELLGQPPAGIRQPELGFDAEGRMYGCAGINRVMGSYTEADGVLACGLVGMTMMAGPPDAMAYEQAFVAALAEPLDIVETPDGIDLARAGAPVIRLTRPPAA